MIVLDDGGGRDVWNEKSRRTGPSIEPVPSLVTNLERFVLCRFRDVRYFHFSHVRAGATEANFIEKVPHLLFIALGVNVNSSVSVVSDPPFNVECFCLPQCEKAKPDPLHVSVHFYLLSYHLFTRPPFNVFS